MGTTTRFLFITKLRPIRGEDSGHVTTCRAPIGYLTQVPAENQTTTSSSSTAPWHAGKIFNGHKKYLFHYWYTNICTHPAGDGRESVGRDHAGGEVLRPHGPRPAPAPATPPPTPPPAPAARPPAQGAVTLPAHIQLFFSSSPRHCSIFRPFLGHNSPNLVQYFRLWLTFHPGR